MLYFSILFPSMQSSDVIFMSPLPNLRKYTLPCPCQRCSGEKLTSCRLQIEIKLLLAPEKRAGCTGMGVALGKLGRVARSCRGMWADLLPTAPTCLGGERQVQRRELEGGVFVKGYFKTLAMPSVVRGSALKLFRLCFALPASVAWLTRANGTTD